MALGAITGLYGCVDHDYDLSQDIDMTVAVGGELTVPTSTIAPYSMKKILDLAEDGSSSIRPDGALYGLAQGDYVLVQQGTGSSTTFSVDVVEIGDIASEGTTRTTPSHFTVPADVTIPTFSIRIGGEASSSPLVARVDPIVNGIHLKESDINKALVGLDYVGTDITATLSMDVDIDGTSMASTVKAGTSIAFDSALSFEIISSNAKCAFEGSTLVFQEDAQADGIRVAMRISGLDCKKLAERGQGLVGRNFIYDSDIVTTGEIEVPGQQIHSGDVTVNINTSFVLSNARITSVVGTVDPEITVDDTSFAINDIPDFLRDGAMTLDVDNPQIYLTVDNSSNVSATVGVTLRAMSHENGLLTSIAVNDIPVGPGHNVICISRTGRGNRPASEVTTYVKVDNLNDLIVASIPGYIEVKDCTAKAVQTPVEFTLGRDYTFTTDNEVLAPLAFGPNLTFTYTDSEQDWEEDDLEDYNFNCIKIAAVATSTIPLTMKPSARALFRDDPNGDRSRRVVVTVNGDIAAGTLNSPVESSFSIEIRSEVDNLAGLDGIEYTFTASNPIVGTPLNENQAVTVTSLDMTISGGITMDLND